METLCSARTKLDLVLTEYTNACTALANDLGPKISLNTFRAFCDEVIAELELFTSLEEKMTQVRHTVEKMRNLFSAPVNTLPDEILTHIFHLAIGTQSPHTIGEDVLPTGSLAISQVCMRWRQIAFDSKSLWSCIQISPSHQLISLGGIFAKRSGDMPLTVQVTERLNPLPVAIQGFGTARNVLNDIGPRAETIIIDLETAPLVLPPPRTFPTLEGILTHCTQGKLTQLKTLDHRTRTEISHECYQSSGHWFITAHDVPPSVLRDTPRSSIFVKFDIPHHELEDIFSHLRILKLHRIYPWWTSTAYHGLTELRLTGPQALAAIITTQQLADMLAASPELRFLQFGLEIRQTEITPSPVRLDKLEVFLLQSLRYDTQQAILRLILTKKSPLRISTACNTSVLTRLPAPGGDEFCQFFRLSNIVQLHVHGDLRLRILLPDLLELLPKLETLILREVTVKELEVSNAKDLVIPPCPELRTCYLITCIIDLEAIRWMIDAYNLQRVTIWNGSIGSTKRHRKGRYQDLLKSFCPSVQILECGARELDKVCGLEGWGADMGERIATASMNRYVVD
ncbi:hypothetical protein B0J17DRAFT_680360 [Rhizoctonia solani]|nr:hypothetical protein B0J17DRAFT_680360 [Rhizoctonia solani]